MADKGRFEGLIVNFQALPPKAGQHWLITALKILGIWLVVTGAMYLLSLLI